MDGVTLRDARAGDEAALKTLWQRSFGDGEGFIEDFFARFYSPRNVAVLDCGGEPVSSCFTLWGAELRLSGGESISCPYIYGMDTLPEYRRRGYGALLALDAMKKAADLGGGALALLPASERLYGWYKNAIGARPAFFAREAELAAGDNTAAAAARELTAEGYARRREELLAGRPHVTFSAELMDFQAGLCREAGGAFLSFEGGAACVERLEDGRLFIKELLAHTGAEGAARALMERYSAPAALVRTPVFMAAETGWPVRDFTVASALSRRAGLIPGDAYWGLAFD